MRRGIGEHMGIIRLSLITAVLIWLSMMYFGRDDGLPETLIGREAPGATSQPAPQPVRNDPPPQPEPEPDPEPDPVVAETPEPAPVAPAPAVEPDPEPEPQRTITFTPLEDAVSDAVDDALATPDPAPVPDPAPNPAPTLAEEPAPAPAPGSDFVVDADPEPLLYVTGSRVNVRSGPSTVYEAVTALTRGTAINDLGDAGEGWRMIRLPNGGIGYMSGDFLSPVTP